ncbi:hypothetical protein DB30_04851 [Enhygromyxa salina]|uniref:Uncharacterized protein n=1 Tax=Enhygromyxa salina TaxID=215803 RepID=A0A0C1ZF39_9BACT|nr:hypothetical protein [Enhygromyxa salina]KIG16239.1 hypothetical protein DB30_04851 [Enhygromyxa salina]
MSEVAKAVKPLFDKFIDFFDIFDLSFFVSGATFVAAIAWAGLTPDLAQLLGFEPTESGGWLVTGQMPGITVVALILASYVSGMSAFAVGRFIRKWVFRAKDWIVGAPRHRHSLFDDLERHGVLIRRLSGHGFRVNPEFDRIPWLKRYLIDGGEGKEPALYVRMWAEIRQRERFAPSFSLLRRYWVSAATLDGLFVAFCTWGVLLALKDHTVHGWFPCAATLCGAVFCLREAQRYGVFQREELVATLLHVYDLPDQELAVMMNGGAATAPAPAGGATAGAAGQTGLLAATTEAVRVDEANVVSVEGGELGAALPEASELERG